MSVGGLKPCRCCNSNNLALNSVPIHGDQSKTEHYVACECGARGPIVTGPMMAGSSYSEIQSAAEPLQAEAIARWNLWNTVTKVKLTSSTMLAMNLTPEERIAVARLKELAASWPGTLEIIGMSGVMCVVREHDPKRETTLNPCKRERIVIEGIYCDGSDE